MLYEIKKVSKDRFLTVFMAVFMIIFAGCASDMAAKNEKKDVEKASSFKLITDIGTIEDSESIKVVIKANRLLTYTSVKQPSPLGVVLYFPETALETSEAVYVPDNEIVSSIKALELTEKGHTSRIEISLKKDLSYEVTREETGLEISFSKSSVITGSGRKEIHNQVLSAAARHGSTHVKQSEKNVAGNISSNITASINQVDFLNEEAGKSTITIGTTAPVRYEINKANDRKIQLKLFNVNLPDYYRRPLITTRFESAVNRIIPVQRPSMKPDAMVVIELREAVPYFVDQTGNVLQIHFEASSIPPKSFEEAKLPSWKKVLSQTSFKIEEKLPEKVDERIPLLETAKKYKGEKIALDFYETDIKNVFRILKDVSAKNFAIDHDVTGNVTLTLDKPVPWDQVLDLILKMNQLDKVCEGDIIRIATLETLKKEEELRQARLEAAKKAKEQKRELEPLITEYISVNYSNATEDILPHLENIKSKDRGSISVNERTSQIIMTDVADKIRQAKAIVKKLDRITPQVIIEARIVEANTDFSRDFGIKWNIVQGPFDALNGELEYDIALNQPGKASPNNSIGFTFNNLFGSFSIIDAKLMAQESQGDVKIISAPKIVTLDNTEATIKQGKQVPFNTLDEAGNTVTEFKDIDLELKVTPQVTADNRILMKINITKNDLQFFESGAGVLTNEANTELLIEDGGTVVIGGIIISKKDNIGDGIPGLSKLPVIGWLFKSKSIAESKSE
ncbi:MAG: type IV pilus secretin PilQ, partial [Deltaproteobacteria bacterium]|nr:type IV pilus secretin PilQ [Deltaproteobacteria bacterium]